MYWSIVTRTKKLVHDLQNKILYKIMIRLDDTYSYATDYECHSESCNYLEYSLGKYCVLSKNRIGGTWSKIHYILMQNYASAIFRISGTHAKFNKLSKNWVHLIQFTRYSFKNLLSTLYSMKQTNVYCSTMTSVWLYCCKKLLAVLNVHLRGDHYLGSMFRKLRNVAKKQGYFVQD